MHGAHAFLAALATVLGVAAATTILFQRLGQPVVLGYLIAGLIIGPHVPIPLVADAEIVETLSELGVILLMFSVGLELRIRTLVRMAPTAGVTALIQCSLMVWLGFLAGRLSRAGGQTGAEDLWGAEVIAYLAGCCSRLRTTGSAKREAADLRSLLRFLYLKGITGTDLGDGDAAGRGLA